MNSIIRLSALFIAFALLSSCTKKLAESIQRQAIPNDLSGSVLLVEKFEHRDPMVYDPYFQTDSDSLQKVTGFKVGNIDLEAEDSPLKKEHPLIVQTNENLFEYNRQLERSLNSYDGQYLLVDKAQLESGTYGDTEKYRYILKYKPVLHCYIDPRSETFLSYRYMYYFHDRKTGKDLPEIQIFAPDPWRTTKAIVYKANKIEG